MIHHFLGLHFSFSYSSAGCVDVRLLGGVSVGHCTRPESVVLNFSSATPYSGVEKCVGGVQWSCDARWPAGRRRSKRIIKSSSDFSIVFLASRTQGRRCCTYTSLNVNEEKGKDKNSRCALPPNVNAEWVIAGRMEASASAYTGFYNIYSIYSGVVVRTRNSSPTQTTL